MSDQRTRTIRRLRSFEVVLAASVVCLMTASMAFSQALQAASSRSSRATMQSTMIPAPAAAVATGERKNATYDTANSVAAMFALQVYDSGGIQAGSVAVGDLNGDGGLDLAVTNQCTFTWMSCDGGGSVAVFMNAGGSFSGPAVYSSGGSRTGGVVMADINQDNKLDIVVYSACWGTVPQPCLTEGVLFGNGDGSLQAVQPYSGPVNGKNVSWSDVPDFNSDGILDAAYASGVDSPPGSVYVQLGNADGTYQPPVVYSSGGMYAIAVVVVDVNGDGYPDILALNQCPNNIACTSPGAAGAVGVLISNGDGTFQPTISFGTGGVGSSSITAADVNRDNKPDILVANQCNDQGMCPTGNGTLGVLVNTAAYTGTATTLVSSLNPSRAGSAVTFIATVTPATGTVPDSERVTFKNGNAILGSAPLNGGVASFTTKTLPVGTLNITASYGFDGIYGASHAQISQLVKAARAYPTALSLTATPNPTYGDPVTFVAVVTSSGGAVPDGETVTFYDGTTVIGTGATANGVASFSSMLAPRVHYIKAVYPGDPTFNASTGVVKEQAFGKESVTDVNIWPNPLMFGQSTTLSAMVYPGTFLPFPAATPGPTGTVKFKYNGSTIGTATLQDTLYFMGFSSATFTTSSLNAGSLPIEVVYSGDSTYAPSTSRILNVVVQQATTASTLTSSMNPSALGQPVTLSFTVTSPTVVPKGPVIFSLGPTTLGIVQLKGGVARLTTSSLPAGRNWIKVTYAGNSNIASTKASVTQTVQ